jgi:hypothetical protein
MRYYPNAASSVTGGDYSESAGAYAAWLNDGLALLARVHPAPGAVLCLDWDNPFPFSTGTKPVLGDQIAWHVGRYITLQYHPDARRLLDQAMVVMEPKESVLPVALVFKRTLFGEQLRAEFALAGESADWRAWLRKAAPKPTPSS